MESKDVREKTYFTYETGFGNITIVSDGNAIISVKAGVLPDHVAIRGADTLTDRAARQLDEYFMGKRRGFDLPLDPHGTCFQRTVWEALIRIPYGETRSYKQIAQAIGNPNACRAVGMANNKNPIWIVIPCHRVIGSDGSLTGYGGGLEMKQRLLELESNEQ